MWSQRHPTWMILVLVLMSPISAFAQSLQVLDDIPGAFVDVSSSQPLIFGIEDEVEVSMSIGNFVFPAGTIVVANNGGVAFRNPPSNDLAAGNQPLPSVAAFGGGQSILAYWDDFDDKDGDVYLAQQDGQVVIQWHDRRLGANPASTARFQIQIFEDVGPSGVVAQIVYDDIEQSGLIGGSSATIGYQDGDAGLGDAQWSFNTAGAVADGTVLSLIVLEPTPVPTTSGWGYVVTVLVLLLAATFCIRRTNRSRRTA